VAPGHTGDNRRFAPMRSYLDGTMRRACAHAIADGARFYSYSDACLLYRSGSAV